MDHRVPTAVGTYRDSGGGERLSGSHRVQHVGGVAEGAGQRRRTVDDEGTPGQLAFHRGHVEMIRVFVGDQDRVGTVQRQRRLTEHPRVDDQHSPVVLDPQARVGVLGEPHRDASHIDS
ncbi:hypothetical protein GCM10029963_38430 [Micromonospora andamanensis]